MIHSNSVGKSGFRRSTGTGAVSSMALKMSADVSPRAGEDASDSART